MGATGFMVNAVCAWPFGREEIFGEWLGRERGLLARVDGFRIVAYYWR